MLLPRPCRTLSSTSGSTDISNSLLNWIGTFIACIAFYALNNWDTWNTRWMLQEEVAYMQPDQPSTPL